MVKVRFLDWDCDVVLGEYSNGNTSIELFDEVDGPIAVATVNLDVSLPNDQAYIKNYSENEGMLDALEDAGIVIDVLGMAQTGYVNVPLCQLDLEKCRG
jgi:hypothetical protein